MDAAITSNETLVDALALRIRTYKKEHSHLSGAQIARRFSMTSSSFNRIENGDVRVPTIDQVLKVLRGTGATGDILKYLDANYPQIAETYRSVYDSKNTEFVPQDLEAHLNDKDKFLIILLALTGEGTSREEVLNEFGRKGLLELESLLDKGHLLENDGKINKGNKDLTASLETLSKVLTFSVEECYKPGNLTKQDNLLHYKAIGVKDHNIAKQVVAILNNAEEQLKDLFNDESNLGSHKIFYGLVTDSLLNGYSHSNVGEI